MCIIFPVIILQSISVEGVNLVNGIITDAVLNYNAKHNLSPEKNMNINFKKSG